MKISSFFLTLLILNGNACCRETEYVGFKQDDDTSNNLTFDDDDDVNNLLADLMKPQRFTPGTLLGLLVASLVVVVGSFLVLWRLCCDVEMVITREVIEPLNSISQKVVVSPPRASPRRINKRLLGHRCNSTVLEIA